ncbi:MAG: diguanylate cyclase [Rubrivivax sp.]
MTTAEPVAAPLHPDTGTDNGKNPQALDDHEALIQFVYLAPIGLAQLRADGEIVMINPLCAQLLMPLCPDGQLANLFTALQGLVPDLPHRVRAFTQPNGSICDAQQLPLHVLRSGRPGAKQQPQVLSLSLLKLDDDRLMAVLSDITQSVQRERQLRRNQAWMASLTHGLTDYALVSLDPCGQIDDWNPSIGRVTGFDQQATVGQSLQLFYPPQATSHARLLDRLHEADETGWSLDEGWRVRADGSRFWGSCLIAPLQPPEAPAIDGAEADPPSHGYSLIIQDISDRREAAEALRQSICCDHLTGLANRRAFYDAAELEVQRWHRMPRPLSVLMIDADHFKAINDRHGHDAGDAVLRALADGLAAGFRGMDVVARIGGEEFVVLLPGTTLAAANMLAQRVATQLSQIRVVVGEGQGRQEIGFTVSIGAANMDAGVDGVGGLLKRADQALYAAKSLGRNRVECFAAPPIATELQPRHLAEEV